MIFKLNLNGLVPLVNKGVNFINVLRAAFTDADPESAKKRQSSCQSFLRFQDLPVQKLPEDC